MSVQRSNGANEPRAAVTGSHKSVGRDGSICVLDGPSKEPAPDETLARESHCVRMTREAARGDANGGHTRTVPCETLRPFSAPTGRPECSNESWPDSKARRGYGDSNDSPSGAMATPPTLDLFR